MLTTKLNRIASLSLLLFKSVLIFRLSLYFNSPHIFTHLFIPVLFPSFTPPSHPFSYSSPLLPSLLPLSVVWSNNSLIIGCKKYLLRDYARYKKLTGDGSQNLSASLMRPRDCKARSAETEHPPLALHWGPTQLCMRQLSPAQPSSAQLCSAQFSSARPWSV